MHHAEIGSVAARSKAPLPIHRKWFTHQEKYTHQDLRHQEKKLQELGRGKTSCQPDLRLITKLEHSNQRVSK